MYTEFKILIHYSFSNLIVFISLIILIFFNNFLGLFPYIFTSSRHIRFCFALVRLVLYFVINYLGSFLAHLNPMGTPFVVIPFMVIIESISLVIRPITLSISLTVNMIAGHLLLSLLSSSGIGLNSFVLLVVLVVVQFMLFVLEIFISLIQAYVFSILSFCIEGKFNLVLCFILIFL
ncbi:ATP synthase subunit a [Trachymyrmex zeteki]|uniref:F-ATPase protein 6 n=1 Tax=Mycetomoellerius zeteki TaxID=64791 RepID=A0A151WIQ2_9HYME|nr:ATP synthase subunit a [Trachymyrmex zeteki]